MSMMTRLLLGLTIIGGMFSFLGGRDYWHASKADSTPEILTAAQLLARGAEGNPFVEVSEISSQAATSSTKRSMESGRRSGCHSVQRTSLRLPRHPSGRL